MIRITLVRSLLQLHPVEFSTESWSLESTGPQDFLRQELSFIYIFDGFLSSLCPFREKHDQSTYNAKGYTLIWCWRLFDIKTQLKTEKNTQHGLSKFVYKGIDWDFPRNFTETRSSLLFDIYPFIKITSLEDVRGLRVNRRICCISESSLGQALEQCASSDLGIDFLVSANFEQNPSRDKCKGRYQA